MKLIAKTFDTCQSCDWCGWSGYNMVKAIDQDGWAFEILCWDCTESMYKDQQIYQIRGGDYYRKMAYSNSNR